MTLTSLTVNILLHDRGGIRYTANELVHLDGIPGIDLSGFFAIFGETMPFADLIISQPQLIHPSTRFYLFFDGTLISVLGNNEFDPYKLALLFHK